MKELQNRSRIDSSRGNRSRGSRKIKRESARIWSDEMIEGLSKIVEICHHYETPVFIQIHHAGFKEKISEVSTERLDEILDLFVKAFHRAKRPALMELKFMELMDIYFLS